MSDFVSDEHIVQTVPHILPAWKGENPIPRIEGSGFRFGTMDNRNILIRQETSENRLALDVGFRAGHAYIVAQFSPQRNLFNTHVGKMCITREI